MQNYAISQYGAATIRGRLGMNFSLFESAIFGTFEVNDVEKSLDTFHVLFIVRILTEFRRISV